VVAVFQDFGRYELTVRDNIAFGSLAQADDEEGLRAVARQAGLLKFIDVVGTTPTLEIHERSSRSDQAAVVRGARGDIGAAFDRLLWLAGAALGLIVAVVAVTSQITGQVQSLLTCRSCLVTVLPIPRRVAGRSGRGRGGRG
jgi:hypothetical protein